MEERLMTLNFCEKCRRGYSDLKKNLHGELLCKECFASQEKVNMKLYNCELCGREVFKQCEHGIVVVKELRKIEGNYHESINHSCLFVKEKAK